MLAPFTGRCLGSSEKAVHLGTSKKSILTSTPAWGSTVGSNKHQSKKQKKEKQRETERNLKYLSFSETEGWRENGKVFGKFSVKIEI